MSPPITPGEILIEEYLTPMGISQNAMARAIGVAPRAINEIVLGHRAITPVMSIRFGAFFGQTPEFWHGLQVECDFRALGKMQKKLTAKIRPAQTRRPHRGLNRPPRPGGRKNSHQISVNSCPRVFQQNQLLTGRRAPRRRKIR